MPFDEKETKKLKALLEETEKTADGSDLDFRAVPHLREMDETVTARLAAEAVPDRETLRDGAAILRYLAEAYDRLGRFAVSAGYYGRAIDLAARLYGEYGEKTEDAKGLVYNALRARNYYLDDGCPDLKKAALVFLSQEVTEEVFRTVMEHPRSLRHDPVEMTEEYLAVIDEVEARIEQNRELRGFGSCHHVWSLKTEYLAERGIAWRSPALLNPRVRFD